MASTTDNLTLALHVKGAQQVASSLRLVATAGTAIGAIGAAIGVATGSIVSLGAAAMKAAADEEVLAMRMRAVFGKGAGDEALRWAEQMSMGIQGAVANADELAAVMMRLRSQGLDPTGFMGPLADVGAALGADKMMQLAEAFGKVKQMGSLGGRQVMAFMTMGIDLNKILVEQLGITVEKLRAMGQKGIPEAMAIPAILKGLQQLYAGSAEAASKTIKGTMGRIKNTVGETMDTIGAAIWPSIQPGLERIQKWFADPKNLDTIFQYAAKVIAAFQTAGQVVEGMLTQLFTDRGIPKWLGNIEIEMLNIIGLAMTFYTTMQGIKAGASKGWVGSLLGAGAGFVAGSALHMSVIDKQIKGIRNRMDSSASPSTVWGRSGQYASNEKKILEGLRKNAPGMNHAGAPKGLAPGAIQSAAGMGAGNGVMKYVEAVIIGGAARARGAVKAMDIGIGPGRSRPRVDIYWHSDKGGDIDKAVQRKAEDVTKQAIMQLIRQGWGPKAATTR
jgi:hypothetical protein